MENPWKNRVAAHLYGAGRNLLPPDGSQCGICTTRMFSLSTPCQPGVAGHSRGTAAVLCPHSQPVSPAAFPGERPYCCDQCGKQFTQLNALQRHHRIHTGEKPFMCNACGRTFTDKSTLRRHTSVRPCC